MRTRRLAHRLPSSAGAIARTCVIRTTAASDAAKAAAAKTRSVTKHSVHPSPELISHALLPVELGQDLAFAVTHRLRVLRAHVVEAEQVKESVHDEEVDLL